MTIRSFPSIATQTKTLVGQVGVGGFIYHVQILKFEIPTASQPPSRPFEIYEAPARAILGACVRAWVRGWVDRYVRPCVRGCTRVGARHEVHKLQFESIAPRGSVGYFLSPAPCSGVGPTFLPRARVAGRGGCADVLCVSVVSEVKLPASSSDRDERQTT